MIDLSQYDTDKSALYLDRYTREFGHLFSAEVNLLELGVHRGGSLYLWRDLFPNGRIVGLDLNPVSIEDDSGRIKFYQGLQQDPALLDRIGSEVAPNGFDIVIDDASHLGKYTRDSFWHLFRNHLKSGGIYAIDDWGCAYWDSWPDGHAYVGSRAAIGDFGPKEIQQLMTESRRGRVTSALRASTHPASALVPSKMRASLKTIYRKLEGKHRFSSHQYGMSGFIKQLVDAVSQPSIDGNTEGIASNGVESLHIYDSQAFIHKSNRA